MVIEDNLLYVRLVTNSIGAAPGESGGKVVAAGAELVSDMGSARVSKGAVTMGTEPIQPAVSTQPVTRMHSFLFSLGRSTALRSK